MTKEIKKDPLDDVVLHFEFKVVDINNLLHLLGNAPLPFVSTAPFISEINRQGEPQYRAAMEKLEKAKHEPQAAS